MSIERELFRKFISESKKYIHEISDETKASYLAKRQAQVKSAEDKYLDAQSDLEMQKAKLNRAGKMLNKADLRQIEKFPDKTDLDTARDMLNDLKSKMRKVDDPRSWEIEEMQDGNYHALNLYVKGWGEWVERGEDDDQAPLSDKYKSILQKILIEVQKQYGIKIINQGSEKKGLSFDVIIQENLNNVLNLFDEWVVPMYLEDSEKAISTYADTSFNSEDIIVLEIEKKGNDYKTLLWTHEPEQEAHMFYDHIPEKHELVNFIKKGTLYKKYKDVDFDSIPEIPATLKEKLSGLDTNSLHFLTPRFIDSESIYYIWTEPNYGYEIRLFLPNPYEFEETGNVNWTTYNLQANDYYGDAFADLESFDEMPSKNQLKDVLSKYYNKTVEIEIFKNSEKG